MTCFVFSLRFPLSLPFDWTFEILSILYVCCFVLVFFLFLFFFNGCYVMMLCVKINKNMLIRVQLEIPSNPLPRQCWSY